MPTKIPDRPVERVEYALDIHGLKIFPVKGCGSKDPQTGGLKDKTPTVTGWSEWAEKTKRRKITDYAKSNRATNWGVHTGHSGIVIIDVDVKHGKDGRIALLALCTERGQKLDPTLTVKTPSGGIHYYYKLPGGKHVTGGVNKLGEGVDVQAGGKYALMYGSRIETGKTFDGKEQTGGTYEVISEADDIKPIPIWLLQELQSPNGDKPQEILGKKPTPKIEGIDSEENIEKATLWLTDEAPPCVEGSERGGEYLLQIFYKLRDMGISKDTADVLTCDHYNERCEPPWYTADDGVDKIHWYAKLKNAYNYAQNENIGAETHEARLLEAKDEFKDYDKQNPPPPLEYERSIPLHDFVGDPPKREWLIPNWLPLNEISSLYGAGGAGKSLLALQMAMSVSTGNPFLGLAIPNKIPSLVVFCEDSKDELHRRITAVRAAPEYTFVEAQEHMPLRLWPRVGKTNDIARTSNSGNDIVDGPFKKILEKELSLMPEGNKLLILDTLSDVYMGDENVREKVNKFVKTHLGGLVIKHSLTVLILAHPSRTGQNTKDMLSGSTAWNNAVRNRLVLMQYKKEPDTMVFVRMKSNYAKQGEEIFLQWRDGRFELRPADPNRKIELAADDLDLLTLVRRDFSTTGTYSLAMLSRKLISDQRNSHLMLGQSPETVVRKLMRIFRYRRTVNGLSYYYAEGDIYGKQGRRWLVIRPAEETEAQGDKQLKQLGAPDLVGEEKLKASGIWG